MSNIWFLLPGFRLFDSSILRTLIFLIKRSALISNHFNFYYLIFPSDVTAWEKLIKLILKTFKKLYKSNIIGLLIKKKKKKWIDFSLEWNKFQKSVTKKIKKKKYKNKKRERSNLKKSKSSGRAENKISPEKESNKYLRPIKFWFETFHFNWPGYILNIKYEIARRVIKF